MRVRHAASASRLDIPGFDGRLPDAVLVRSIAAGTFEAVTLRLGVLHASARLSACRSWNSAQRDRALRRQVDDDVPARIKRAACRRRPDLGVSKRPAGRAIVARMRRATPLVLKPLFGAQGGGCG